MKISTTILALLGLVLSTTQATEQQGFLQNNNIAIGINAADYLGHHTDDCSDSGSSDEVVMALSFDNFIFTQGAFEGDCGCNNTSSDSSELLFLEVPTS